MLIAAGADLNARQKDGKTALHYAAQYGPAEALRLLLAAGADATLRDANGQTPLDLATANRRPANAELLSNQR